MRNTVSGTAVTVYDLTVASVTFKTLNKTHLRLLPSHFLLKFFAPVVLVTFAHLRLKKVDWISQPLPSGLPVNHTTATSGSPHTGDVTAPKTLRLCDPLLL